LGEFEAKRIVQYARWKKKPEFLSSLNPEDVEFAKEFLKKLDEPLFHRWLLNNEVNGYGYNINYHYTYEFNPPTASDPLLNTTLEFLMKEYLDFLEEKYFVGIEYKDDRVLLFSFEEVDLNELFWKFLKEKYDDKFLRVRWGLIKSVYNLKEFPRIIPTPFEVRDLILTNKIGLEVKNESVSFGDDAKSFCLFCGRDSENFEVKTGYVEFASQRPQKGFSTQNPQICPICVFSVYISPIRTSMGTGQQKTDLVALKTSLKESKFSYIFNRLLGVSTGDYISIFGLGQQEAGYGKTALTYLSSSRIPLYVLNEEEFEITNLLTNSNLSREKILAIKIFEKLLGYSVMWRVQNNPRAEQEYRKALLTILNGEYFSLFRHLGVLAQNLRTKNRELILDSGIYHLIKSEVIKMEERPDIVFGTALLIDAFLPRQWQKESDELKTEVRKVAYYLEKPEEVLYRLRQIKKEDYATLERDFSNKAQFKLLKELLKKIHEEENLGDFEEEQTERRKKIEEISGNTYDDSERLFLRYDDILKVYMYIQRILSEQYHDPKKLKKKYSELVGRIKYALVARRPELLGGE